MNHEKSLDETLALFRQGKSIPEIAYKRKLAFSTIEHHLAELIARKTIEIEELISVEKIKLIKKAIPEQETTLTFIKDSLPQEITFAEIKWVLASTGKLRERERKLPIVKAINFYRGNNCFRKCFNHEDIVEDCGEKFRQLAEHFGKDEISLKEFYRLMNKGELQICKLPENKRRAIVMWNKFMEMKDKDKDFWDE